MLIEKTIHIFKKPKANLPHKKGPKRINKKGFYESVRTVDKTIENQYEWGG